MAVAGAQTGASTSTNTNTSASAGQTGANASASQSTQVNANATTAAAAKATTLRAELTKSLDAKKAKAGDEVTARVTEDAKDGGQVIRKGSKLIGHVTEAQARSKENAESKLGIVFDKAILKDGSQVNLNAIVMAVAPEPHAPMPSMPDDNSRMGGGSAPMGGGPIGGVAPSAAGVGSTISGVSGNVTSAAGAATGNAGGLAGGTLATTARGVIGIEGVTLGTSASGSANTQASVLSSTSRNIKLDSGTQMVLQVNGSIQP